MTAQQDILTQKKGKVMSAMDRGKCDRIGRACGRNLPTPLDVWIVT